MATKLGNDRLMWVETATPGIFVVVGSQGDFSRSRSRSSIGTATKTSNWDTERAGLPKGKCDVSLLPDLPDTGYARLEALCKAEPQVPFRIQLRKGGTAANTTTDVEFDCSVTCGEWNDDAPQNDIVKAKGSFLYASAPSVDTLA